MRSMKASLILATCDFHSLINFHIYMKSIGLATFKKKLA